MEEYLKLNWRTTDFSLLSSEFIPESSIPSSYIFKGLEDIKDDDFIDNGKPFVPGSNYFKPIIKKTCLSKQQHVDCLHALQIMMKSKDKLNQYSMSTLELYNTLRSSIAAETKEFCEYVKQQWSTGAHNYHVRNYYKLYVHNIWKRNYDFIKSYQQMFICIKSLPISISQLQSKVEVAYKQQLLDLGTVAKYLGPRLLDKCLLNNSSLPTNTVNTVLDFKKPMSSDRNINLIVENIPVDIVISMSGLKTLMDCDANKSWDIPIIVKQMETTKNGEKVMKSVVYIDKVLKTPKTNQLLVKERAFKEVIKTAFCCYKAFSYDSQGLSEIITDAKIQNEESADKADSKEFKIHQNASYKLWSWKPNEVNELLKCRKYKELTVLIRNKMDACELLPTGQLQTVTLVPKLEYQLEFGGNISTKRELIHQWCSLYFRPMSKLYRVRTHAVTSEVIMVEPCNIDKIVYEAQTHHNFHPNIGLQIVYNIFSTLSDLSPGNYLLHHTPNDGSFVSLLKSTTATAGNVFNLHSEYNETNYSMELLKTPPWIAIDTNLVLAVHEELQLVPGLFAGFGIATNKKRKQFNNKNNKWKHKINTTTGNKDKEKFKKNSTAKKKKNNKAKRKKPNSETTSNT